MLYTSPWSKFEPTASVVIDTDSIGSCKYNRHMIMAMTVPRPDTDLVADNNQSNDNNTHDIFVENVLNIK